MIRINREDGTYSATLHGTDTTEYLAYSPFSTATKITTPSRECIFMCYQSYGAHAITIDESALNEASLNLLNEICENN